MRCAHLIIVGSLAAGVFPILPASAQTEPGSGEVPSFEAPPPLDAELRFGLYRPRVTGSSRLGAGARELDLDDELRLDDSENIGNFEGTLRRNDWQLRIGGFYFSTDTIARTPVSGSFGAVNFNAGDEYRASLDISTMSIELGLDLWKPIEDDDVQLRFTPFVGARWIAVDQDMTSNGVEDGASSSWLAMSGGIQFRVRYEPAGGVVIGRALDFEAGVAAGYAFGGDGGTAWQVHANITLDVTDHFGVFFGYRLVEVYADDDDFRFEGGVQGLFVGGVLRF